LLPAMSLLQPSADTSRNARQRSLMCAFHS
jgi:hypothetical protein